MNIEAVRRVRVTLTKAEVIKLLKDAQPTDIHVQALGTSGSPVEMSVTNEGVTLSWFSGPLAKVEQEVG